MHLISDHPATARRCWPARDFGPHSPVSREPWLETLLGESARTENGPVTWGRHDDTGFWDRCLLMDRAADSQYDQLRRMDPDQAAEAGNLACLALTGTQFHGQRGRPWQTLAGNFHLSLRVALDLPAATFNRSLMMLPAVVVLDVLATLEQPLPGMGIKWVNDILIDGRKVAGVLTSTRTENGRLVSVVFGVGVNVARYPETMTSLWPSGATALDRHLAAGTPDLGPLMDLFLFQFESRLEELVKSGPTPIFEQYRRHSLILDKVVTLWPTGTDTPPAGQAPIHRGKVLDIFPDLTLRLEGLPEPVSEGRLEFPA